MHSGLPYYATVGCCEEKEEMTEGKIYSLSAQLIMVQGSLDLAKAQVAAMQAEVRYMEDEAMNNGQKGKHVGALRTAVESLDRIEQDTVRSKEQLETLIHALESETAADLHDMLRKYEEKLNGG